MATPQGREPSDERETSELTRVERRHGSAGQPSVSAIKASRIINYLFVLVEGLIGLRLLLQVLGGNPANGFVDFIYSITAPFVSPFLSVFNWGTVSTSIGIVEFGSILAIAFYVLLNYAIVRLIWILSRR